MKIAIQGHPTRGKEVIQILENLGGKLYSNIKGNNLGHILYIDYCDRNIIRWSGIKLPEYKIYTLEEFKKEFPFKIGDEVICLDYSNKKGTIVSIELCGPIFLYFIKLETGNGIYRSAKHLKSYKEMEKERNITLTLDKAKEWYQKGGELKEIALQAFTERELSPLPKSWEDYCKLYKVPSLVIGPLISCKYAALWKLEQLRDCYRQGWAPMPKETVYAIKYADKDLNVYYYSSQEFLSFQSREIAEEFLKNFERLIKEAGDLI
ncbi:MAG: hypothetical protein J6V44_12800 [Methanobrevibacter sp.]|nr:hypothetical protein [Methanobrevibacter sp.]